MARKTLADIDPRLRSATEEFEAISLVKYDMAKDAYEVQDAETQRTIDRMVATLQQYATGYINVKVGSNVIPVKITNEYLGFNLLFLAVEIVKDLAIMGQRVSGFDFPEAICATCGAEIIPEKVPAKKVRR